MNASNRRFSFSGNDLWRYIAFDLCRKYQASSNCSSEQHLAVMAEILQIWRNRSGMRLLLCSTDKQTALFLDGSPKGVIIRMITSDFTWEIRLEDRKWIFGKQIVRLVEVLKELDNENIEFTIE